VGAYLLLPWEDKFKIHKERSFFLHLLREIQIQALLRRYYRPTTWLKSLEIGDIFLSPVFQLIFIVFVFKKYF
jgi:hypothetical protein